jgi:hypothetical protein
MTEEDLERGGGGGGAGRGSRGKGLRLWESDIKEDGGMTSATTQAQQPSQEQQQQHVVMNSMTETTTMSTPTNNKLPLISSSASGSRSTSVFASSSPRKRRWWECLHLRGLREGSATPSTKTPKPLFVKKQKVKSKANGNASTLWLARAVFVIFLAVAAGCLGYVAYLFQYNSEIQLATSQLDAIVDRAIDMARDITHRKMLGASIITSLYANAFPSPEQWPYVYLNGLEASIGHNMVALSKGRGMGFAPIVEPSQVTEFEEWAYRDVIPNGQSVSDFGKGIFAFGNDNATDNRYHDVTGETSYNSPYDIIAPIIQAVNPFIRITWYCYGFMFKLC